MNVICCTDCVLLALGCGWITSADISRNAEQFPVPCLTLLEITPLSRDASQWYIMIVSTVELF